MLFVVPDPKLPAFLCVCFCREVQYQSKVVRASVRIGMPLLAEIVCHDARGYFHCVRDALDDRREETDVDEGVASS